MLESLPVSVVASPCVSVCKLDEDKICVGCGRALSEIAEWSRASDGRRRQICVEAEKRRATLPSTQEL